MVDTKIKGITTELLCQAYLTSLGYNISVPIGEDCRYDMILDTKLKLLKIQVKTCKEKDTGIEFNLYSLTTSGKENIKHNYSSDEIDLFATYFNNQCYLIPVQECKNYSNQITLSFTPIQKNQNVNFFIENYTAENTLSNLLNKEIKLKNDLFNEKQINNNYNILYQYDLNGNLVNKFYSYYSAAKSLGKESGSNHISQCARGLRNMAYGYIWKWQNNNETG